jgi:hypothetical protein
MFGNNNSLTTYKKFEMMSKEKSGKAETETQNLTNSLFSKQKKKTAEEKEELSPTDIAFKFFSIINKERLNGRTE